MRRIVSDEALDTLFRAARSPRTWLARPVSDTLLRAVWELVKLGPMGEASHPARLLFAKSDSIKAKLATAIADAQRLTVVTAPVVAIVGDTLDAKRRTGTALGAAYLILAARALGLECAPVWDFDGPIVDAAVFPESGFAASFLCALGYGGDAQPVLPEQPSGPDGACRIL